MLLIAVAGMVARSGPCVPDPPIDTNAALCRRLEFTNTSVLSVGKPRMVAGRMNVAPSLMGWRLTP